MVRHVGFALLPAMLLACPEAEPGPTPSRDAAILYEAGVQRDASATLDAGPSCGDGQQQAGETCDDGNTIAGDGCGQNCQIERGHIELAQPEPQAEVSHAILVRGSGFRYLATLRICTLQNDQCRFELQTISSDDQGRVIGPDGQAARIQADQPLEAVIALCDDELGTCSNGLTLRWIEVTEECTEDGDCAQAERCLDGRCVAAPTRCTDEADCPLGHFCEEGVCVDPQQRPCEDHAQCPPGDLCIDGLCVEPARNCTSHNDCPLHQGCDLHEGLCVALPGGTCRDNQHCQIRCVVEPGEVLGSCIDCERNEECPEGAVCRDSQCAAPRCNEENCRAPARCDNDRCIGGIHCNEQNCPAPSRCENDRCIPGNQPQRCQNHGQCQANEQCLITGIQGACVLRCNVGHQQQVCAGDGTGECICNMVRLRCNHQTGLCE